MMMATSRMDNYNHGRSEAAANLSMWIDQQIDFLHRSFQEAKHRVDRAITQINEARNKFENLQARTGGDEMDSELHELEKKVSKLKKKIPFNLITPSYDDHPNPNVNHLPRPNPQKQPLKSLDVESHSLPHPLFDDDHPTREALQSSVSNLTNPKISLQCFLVFPANAIIKKSMLDYWIETHIVDTYDANHAFRFSNKHFTTELISKGIVKPLYKNFPETICAYWMHPFVRSNLKEWFPVEDGKYLVSSIDGTDVIYEESEKFSVMKDLVFLHLGKWEKSSKHHAEMEDPELYFKDIKHMRKLIYISFRGTSMITELPRIITKLKKLQVLDLKACHNLEALPSDIGKLRHNLTHLDVSECYFLDYMPASLSQLSNLKVLKGFLVGEPVYEDSCTLQDLVKLRLLTKLNIYTSVKEFPSEDQFGALQSFSALRKLTISWGGCCVGSSEEGKAGPTSSTASPLFRNVNMFKLEKLDLQCVPEKVTDKWLRPSNFDSSLVKLYIRGGDFNELGLRHDQKEKGLVDPQQEKWYVDILRLKYLNKLDITWSEFLSLFPCLVSLEKVECPYLTSFPCDRNGFWTSKTRI